MNKVDAYNLLVAERKQCRMCNNLCNPAEFKNGRFDSDEVGPWSRWQGNLDSKIMIVGQDWGDTDYLENNSGLESRANPTNETLRELLSLIGIECGPPGDFGRNGIAFFTNAVLCMKEGGLQATTESSWFDNCRPFLQRQIEIVSPRLLVCLGEKAYRSVATAFGFRAGSFREAVDNLDGVVLQNGTRTFARYHCGRRILNTHRPIDQQREDWRRLATFL